MPALSSPRLRRREGRPGPQFGTALIQGGAPLLISRVIRALNWVIRSSISIVIRGLNGAIRSLT